MAKYKADLIHRPRVKFTCDNCGKEYTLCATDAKTKLEKNKHFYCRDSCRKQAIKNKTLRVGPMIKSEISTQLPEGADCV